MKLYKKLIILFLVISIIPVASLSWFSLIEISENLLSQQRTTLDSLLDSRSTDINHLIQLRQEQAKLIAGTFLPRQLNSSGVNDPKVIQDIQNHIDSIYKEIKLEPTSNYVYIDKTSAVDIIGIWDTAGLIIANTDRDLIGSRMPDEFLQKVKQYGTYFGGFQQDSLTGKNFLIILENIRNWDDEKFAGAVLLKVESEILNEITTDYENLGNTGETYLINEDYLFITKSRFVEDVILNLNVESELLKRCFTGERSFGEWVNYQGVPVFGIMTYLKDQNWCFIGEINSNEVLLPVFKLQNEMILASLIVSSIVVMTAILFSRSITSPIIKLGESVADIRKGKFDSEIEPKLRSKDNEIGQLSQGFEMMRKYVKTTHENLDELVKAQTKKLEIVVNDLKKAELLKEEFSSMVTHELKTPLTPIRGYCEMLKDTSFGTITQDQLDYINKIDSNAILLQRLIGDVLDVQKLDMKRMTFNKQSFDVDKFLDDIKQDNSHLMKEKGIEFIVNNSLNLKLTSDSLRLRQILDNLIKNAVDFVPSKNGKIEIDVNKENGKMVFHVKDNGIGIPKAKQENIFKKFYQVDTSHRRKHGGTGLGLVISKGIIEELGGKIWFESEPGKGSTFSFDVPMDDN